MVESDKNKFSRNTHKVTISDICSECLILILELRLSQEFGDINHLRGKIIDLLNAIERSAKINGYSIREIQDVKFALVAFLDETIISSDWKLKDEWIASPLQMQLFNRFDAGEGFFQRLHELLDQIQLDMDVLQVYYLCLSLGFKGKYAYLEQEKLHVIIDDLYQDLQRDSTPASKSISPNGKRTEEISEIIESEIPFWSIGIATFMITLLIYLFFYILGTTTATNVL